MRALWVSSSNEKPYQPEILPHKAKKKRYGPYIAWHKEVPFKGVVRQKVARVMILSIPLCCRLVDKAKPHTFSIGLVAVFGGGVKRGFACVKSELHQRFREQSILTKVIGEGVAVELHRRFEGKVPFDSEQFRRTLRQDCSAPTFRFYVAEGLKRRQSAGTAVSAFSRRA